MISAGDFKNGLTLEIDGNVVQIMEFQHLQNSAGNQSFPAPAGSRTKKKTGDFHSYLTPFLYRKKS